MSSGRICNLLFSKSTLETTILTAAFITIHVAAYLDREQDIENNAPLSLSLASKILASYHTSAAIVRAWENFEKAGLYINPSKYKIASGTMVAASLGTLAGVWVTVNSKTNVALGVANAACNYLGRFFSSAHRRAVLDELDVNFDNLIAYKPNVGHTPSYEVDIEDGAYGTLPEGGETSAHAFKNGG